MSRHVGRDSKAAILAAALSEFDTYGYAGARVERIARRAGVNKQLLFYYFKSKAGLHRALVERLQADVGARLGGAFSLLGHPESKLRTAIRLVCETLATTRYLVRLLTYGEPASGESSGPKAAFVALREPIRQVVREGQGLGFFRDDADPELTAEHALCAILGYLALGLSEQRGDLAPGPWCDKLAEGVIRSLAW